MKRLIAGAAFGALLCSGLVMAETYHFHQRVNGLKKPVPPVTFTSHTFTHCGQTGYTGPSQSQCESAYSGSEILKPEYNYAVSGGIQSWTVPAAGTYRIKALGARGGSINGYSGGNGALMEATFNFNKGDQLQILVGQVGTGGGHGAGGGGGSFVVKDGSPLLIAGGGGGATSYSNRDGGYGRTEAYGSDSHIANATYGNPAPGAYGGGKGGYGGTKGYGGGAGLAGGGAGWLGNGGVGGHASGAGQSFNNGGAGGSDSAAIGGFGGGGGGSVSNGYGGGGGGYSGGGGGSWSGSTAGNGGGGGSYSSVPISSQSGANSNHGSVTIELLP